MTKTMTQDTAFSRMYLATIIEENDLGFHRESLWYGGTPGNLGLMIIDVMKDWYEPNKDVLDESIIAYHQMLEDNENLTFDMMRGEGFNADGMSISVVLTNNLNDIFAFIIAEICNIFAKNGETPDSFETLSDFREHFKNTYDIDKGLQQVLETVTEATLSQALFIIDIKYGYTLRHFRGGSEQQA